jgi:hypothetical protein
MIEETIKQLTDAVRELALVVREMNTAPVRPAAPPVEVVADEPEEKPKPKEAARKSSVKREPPKTVTIIEDEEDDDSTDYFSYAPEELNGHEMQLDEPIMPYEEAAKIVNASFIKQKDAAFAELKKSGIEFNPQDFVSYYTREYVDFIKTNFDGAPRLSEVPPTRMREATEKACKFVEKLCANFVASSKEREPISASENIDWDIV